MLPFAPSLTSDAAGGWSGARVPGWVPERALTALWFAALIAAMFGDAKKCTPADPSVCGPDQVFAWWLVICLATPLLLIWMPLLGCAAGVAFALADLHYDDVIPAKIGFGLQGLACAVVAVWLLRAAGRQEQLASGKSDAVKAAVPSSHALPHVDYNRARVVAVVGFALLGSALIGWYSHEVSTERSHLSASRQVSGRVFSVDDENFTITLDAATGGGARRVTTGVLDPEPYPKGSTTALLVDPNDLSWSRLVAEPQDATGWKIAGLGAFLLALLLLVREAQTRRARKRLWTGEHPALQVWVVPDDVGAARIFPDDLRRCPVARARVGGRPELARRFRAEPIAWLPLVLGHGLVKDEKNPHCDCGYCRPQDDAAGRSEPNLHQDRVPAVDPMQDAEWDAATVASFGRAWRGEPDPVEVVSFSPDPVEAIRAVLLGSLRDRGWALLVTEEGALVPSGPLRVGHPKTPWATGIWAQWLSDVLSDVPWGPWCD